MTQYYVSLSGNDGNSGTSTTSAWRHIWYAATKVIAGDTVNVMAGTYSDVIPSDNRFCVDISEKNGSSSAWITFRPYQSDVVTIDGSYITYSDNLASVIRIINCSYIHVTGFNVWNSRSRGINIYWSGDHIEVDNCDVYNCSSIGICVGSDLIPAFNNIYLHHNTLDRIHTNVYGGYVGEALSFSRTDYFEIAYNTISRCGKEILDVKAGCRYGSVHHNSIDTSTWTGDPGSGSPGYNHFGIYVDGYADYDTYIDIYNNYIYGNHGSGIVLTGEMGADIKNINVYNNMISLSGNYGYCHGLGCSKEEAGLTIFENIVFHSNTVYTTSSIRAAVLFTGTTSNYVNAVQFKNNIISQSNRNVVFEVQSFSYSAGKITLDHNLFYSFTGTTSSSWNGVVGTQFGTNAIIDNPDFVSYPSNLHIQSVSPARDNGVSTTLFTTDYDGDARGTTWDIGADEYAAGTPLTEIINSASYFEDGPFTKGTTATIANPITIANNKTSDDPNIKVKYGFNDQPYGAGEWQWPASWLYTVSIPANDQSSFYHSVTLNPADLPTCTTGSLCVTFGVKVWGTGEIEPTEPSLVW